MNDSFKTLLDNALIIADPHKIQTNNACDTETAVTTSSTARFTTASFSTASSSTEAKKQPLNNIDYNIQLPKKRGRPPGSKNKSKENISIENLQKKVANLEKLAKKAKLHQPLVAQ